MKLTYILFPVLAGLLISCGRFASRDTTQSRASNSTVEYNNAGEADLVSNRRAAPQRNRKDQVSKDSSTNRQDKDWAKKKDTVSTTSSGTATTKKERDWYFLNFLRNPPDERTTWARAKSGNDFDITKAVRRNLENNLYEDAEWIRINTVDGDVTLTGQVDNITQLGHALRSASNVVGIQNVNNNLQIDAWK